MAKGVKKKNRKLRKQIRKTFGALLMISAIVVATLPVADVSAEPQVNATKIAVVDVHSPADIASATKTYDSTIPYAQDRTDSVSDSEKIVYTSGDGTFQFVYMRPTTATPNKVAVILGYNSGVLQESSLTIPDTLEAYKKFTDNTTREGFCLVSRNDSFLFYESTAQAKDINGFLLYLVPGITDQTTQNALEINEYNTNIKINASGEKVYVQSEDSGEKDESNNPIMKDVEYPITPKMETVYYPCYFEQRSNWESFSDADLYYKDSTGNYVKAGDNNDYWKINAEVAYIGGEKIKDDGSGGWVLDGFIDEPNEGVFANQNNITQLTIGKNLLGISDYAFNGCSTLSSVSLANGLKSIGNGAFANCIRLVSCEIASNANIQAIGKDAFYNCYSLNSFTTPIGLRALGDSCFEGCTGLTTVDLCGGGGAVALEALGDNLFKGCSRLTAVEFPETYRENNLNIDMFDGCSSLQFVKIPNADINFVEDATQTSAETGFAEFINTVPSSFYFEGPGTSNIHTTATAQSIAFKYLGQDLYEKIVKEKDESGGDVNVTYQVNSANELVKFWIEANKRPINVTIPASIGPYGIASIGAGSFNDNCDLQKITIPASVTSIGDNAFQGCHDLKTVIFSDATTMQSIGTNAFKTQEVSCTHSSTVSSNKNPELTFVGAMYNQSTGIDTVPFVYAMNGVSNINNGNQEISWITCHSGWPTNIEVKYQYDPVTAMGEAELQNYPKYSDITTNLDTWLAGLPYLKNDSAKIAEYKAMVEKAVDNYNAYKNGTSTTQPTENELAIVNSALNIVVPTSVDSIKEGIFSGYKADGTQLSGTTDLPNDEMESIVLNGVNVVEPYTFKGCAGLKEAALIGPTNVEDYAFEDCYNTTTKAGIQTVTLGTNLIDTGLRPFKGCQALSNINCLGTNFAYGNGLLFRNAGTDVELVECLEARGGSLGSYTVGPEELAAVTGIKEEAFMNCDKIGKVDLSTSSADVVPERCFENTDGLNSVALPDTIASVEADAFKDSSLRLLTIPASVTYLEKDAFRNVEDYNTEQDQADNAMITFECVEGSAADRYAKQYVYINPEYGKVFIKHIVYFWDDLLDENNPVLVDKQTINDGADAVPPTAPVHDGYTFTGWSNYSNISRDTDVYARYSPIGASVYTVTFVDYDGSTIGTVQQVEEGKSAIPPADPVREGYTFTGWAPDYNNITQNTIVIAQYKDNSGSASRHTVTFYGYDGKTVVVEQKVDDGAAAVAPAAPVRSGYTFIGWVPANFSNVTKDMSIVASYEKNSSDSGGSGSGSGSTSKPTASPTATPGVTSSPEVKKYTVSVSGGSGSGSYAAGAIVSVNAYDMGVGQNFDKWTSSTAGVGFANPNSASTTFTMPAANVAVTATYKTGSGTTTTTTGTGGTTANNNTTGSTGNSNNSGTSVQVTNPGISNENLAGATVSGSTDAFIIKVTEDQAATDAVIAALQAKYGDISRIKYLPMDISMYDSTGRTKIADTSNMAVNLTLPLPDDLVQYAGNNKIAAVSNGQLEELSGRLTTVDGVACINFTAPHFSPYVIYVDTANLVQGTVDATPQTGDPIHPKWFLAMGLACVSLILFFKRDKAIIHTKTA